LGLDKLELLRRDQIQLGFHGEQQLLICQLLFLLLLDLDLLALLPLGLFDGLLDLNLLLGLLPLLAECHTTLLNVVAFDNLVVPEVLNFALLVLLRLAQVGGNFLQIQSAVSLVTIRHELSAITAYGCLLELEVGDGLRSEVHLDRRLVRLVIEVPDVNAVVLRDEDNARAGRAERSTSVLRAARVGRPEDGLFTVEQTDLPNSEVEVMDGQQKIVIEGRPLESKHWS